MANESNNNQIMTAVKEAATNAFIANCRAQGAYACEQQWLCNERCGKLNGFKKRLQENLQSYFGPTADGTINPSGHVGCEDNDFDKAFAPKPTTGKNVNGQYPVHPFDTFRVELSTRVLESPSVWLDDENGSRHSENGKDANFNIFIDENR